MTDMSVIQTVAVLDDNQDDLEMTAMAVEAAGFEVYVLPTMSSIDEALTEIRAHAQALVSDHNLAWGDGASFTGAALVSRCYGEGIPAVLVTGYMMDSHTSIREFRRGVPELVSRSDLDGDRLREALVSAFSELSDQPPRERVPHRALVRVDRVNPDARQLDVVIPQWDPRSKVSMPATLIDPSLVPEDLNALVERRFIAKVNTGAEDENDLYFEQFEDAGPVPDDEEIE
jgi:CheY-like chemotaxis protein